MAKPTATKRTRRASKAAGAAPAAAPPAAPASAPPRITGEVRLAPIDSVKPNTWNPNRMTEFQVESTREGMKANGWIASYALLVWRTDEKGRKRNVIIDGEHRWRIATELGFTEGPMAFIDGISEKRAMEMTIEFDNKRGKFDTVALRDLLKHIGVEDEGLAFRLGFDDSTFEALMKNEHVLPPSDFSEVTIDAKTDYTCPKCGYEWSGKAASKKSESKPTPA